VKAWRDAIRLNGENAERQAALGEALVLAENGVVTADAKAAFDRAIALDANHVQARYFVGLAAEQDGDPERAAAIWRALLAGAAPDAPWREFVQGAIGRVEGSANTSAPGPSQGPSQEQIAASSPGGDSQRDTMIRGMVERLAQRLHGDGSDPQGWLRLVRSYMVLGEPDKARAAAADARRALAGDPTKLGQFEDLVAALTGEGRPAGPSQDTRSGLSQGPLPGPSQGPSQEQIAASSQLNESQRNAMIRGMVERLAQRLQSDGSDPQGWLRLVRSYMVLGEPDKARAAAGDARRALAGDPVKLRQFEDLVKALGLEG